MTDPRSGSWYIPHRVIKLADGATMITPCKAIQRAKVADVVRWTGVHRKTLTALAECGLIRRCMPSPNCPYYYPAEIEDLLRKTEEDPGFWNEVRTRAFLTGRSLKSSRPR